MQVNHVKILQDVVQRARKLTVSLRVAKQIKAVKLDNNDAESPEQLTGCGIEHRVLSPLNICNSISVDRSAGT